MERSLKARITERNFVKRLVNIVKVDLLKTPIPDDEVLASLQMLEIRMKSLTELDEAVKQHLLDEANTTSETLDVEFSECEFFLREATLIKIKADRMLNSRTQAHSHSSHHSVTSTNYHTRVRLPKLELKKFSGELTEWLGWWAQFGKIDSNEDLHESDKFGYLAQSMVPGSKAEEVVKRYPQSTENYAKAINALKERFGQPRLLEDVYMRELAKPLYMSKEKSILSKFYEKLQAAHPSLESLGVSTEEMRRFLFPMIESSLQEEVLIAWQQSANFRRDDSKKNPARSELDFLMSFLKTEIDNEEQRKLARSGFGSSIEKKRGPGRQAFFEDDVPTAAGLFNGSTGSREKPTCVFCERGHESRECHKAQEMTLDKKNKLIKKKGVCYKCLRKGHLAAKCKSAVKCLVCSRKNLALLCDQLEKNKQSESSEKTVLSSLNCTSEVLLSTLIVKLVNPVTKQEKAVRVLLDCGSQRSYVLEKTAKELKLTKENTVTMNHSLFGGTRVMGHTYSTYKVLIGSVFQNFAIRVILMDQPQICGNLPRISNTPWLAELEGRGIRVSDLDPRKSVEIEVLLGADILGKIITGKIHQLRNGLTVTETKFGWTVMGTTGGEEKLENSCLSVISMAITSSTVSQLWDLDTLGIRDPIERKTREERESEALAQFLQTVTRGRDGRYTVSLPWTNGSNFLPSNRTVAERRLENTTRKLTTLGKFTVYNKIFQDWESEGIISPVDIGSNDVGDHCHYLPHRAVFKISETTPVRPVFDASCKIGRNPSLNDCLEKGPNLLELIPSILLRFRMGRIGVTADIRKAFLMINVTESERDFLRFLWWEDSSRQKMKVFRHNRVVFGMTCSPILLGAVILHHLHQNLKDDPAVVTLVERSLYVDNLILAVDTEIEFESQGSVDEDFVHSRNGVKTVGEKWRQ